MLGSYPLTFSVVIFNCLKDLPLVFTQASCGWENSVKASDFWINSDESWGSPTNA